MSGDSPSKVAMQSASSQRILVEDAHGRRQAFSDGSTWELSRLGESDTTPAILFAGEREWETLSLSSLKSISFVESFEQQEHERLHFYDGTPTKEVLWVRLRLESEDDWLEGFLPNSAQLFAGRFVSLRISDPRSNESHRLFPRSRIEAFQVLGLR